MRHAVDLDEVVGALDRRHDAGAAPAEPHPALEAADALDAQIDRGAVDLHAVAVRAETPNGDAVGGAAVAELDDPPHRRVGLGPAPAGPTVEAGLVDRDVGVERVDRGGKHGDVGVAGRERLAARREPVEPGVVELAGAHLGPVEEAEEEPLVGRATAYDDRGLDQCAPQPRERLVAVIPPGHELGDHRVELRRHGVALRDASIDPHAGAGGESQQLDPAGRGREAALGVLGVQPHLDRVPDARRRLARERAAGRHVQLELHEVEPGGDLGHRVLDLEPCVAPP